MKINKKAFTLVELVVVIIILSIISTVGIVSYSAYLEGVRDTTRISQLENINNGLNIYKFDKLLPMPDDYIEIKSNGVVVGYQGYVGLNILDKIEYESDGIDPKDKVAFTYFVTKNRKHFQLMAFLEEEDLLSSNIIGGSYAGVDYNNRYPYVFGEKLGILTDGFNTPVHEITSLETNGLDISTTTDEYISYFSNDETLTGTGYTLQYLENNLLGSGMGVSCSTLLEANRSLKGKDGVYYVSPDGATPFPVYCDMTNGGGGWTVIINYLASETSDINPANDQGMIVNLYGHQRLADDYITKITKIAESVRIQEKGTSNYIQSKSTDLFAINQLKDHLNKGVLYDNDNKDDTHFFGNQKDSLTYTTDGTATWPNIYDGGAGLNIHSSAWGWANNKLDMVIMVK